MATNTCPECGADGSQATCEENFHQFLFWEAEDPSVWEVHHLMVLSYHLQHPSKYSVDGLKHALGLLDDFVGKGLPPQEVRQQIRGAVASGTRTFKITARPDSQGSYAHPVAWTMRAQDVVAGGIAHYVENTHKWAQAIYDDLKATGNL
jgi:hypothetical protein